MAKASQPSPVGLIVVLVIFAFLIWHGPWEERWGKKELEPNDAIQHGTIDCMRDLKYLTPTQIDICIDIQSFSKGSDYE